MRTTTKMCCVFDKWLLHKTPNNVTPCGDGKESMKGVLSSLIVSSEDWEGDKKRTTNVTERLIEAFL